MCWRPLNLVGHNIGWGGQGYLHIYIAQTIWISLHLLLLCHKRLNSEFPLVFSQVYSMNHLVLGAGWGNWWECTRASAKLGNRYWENSDKCLITVLGRVRTVGQEKERKRNNVEGEAVLAWLCANHLNFQRKWEFQSLPDLNTWLL